jgi:hypothetical protein
MSRNGGAYAYVIHEDDPAPSRPPAGAPGEGPGEWPPGQAGPARAHPAAAGQAPAAPSPGSGHPAGPAGQVRAITAGEAAAQARPAPAAAVRPANAATAASEAGPLDQVRQDAGQEARQPDEPGPAVREAAVRESVPDVAPEQMYGPDDPAYGPPGPDWYKRAEERAAATPDGAPQPGTGEQPAARGPFEPHHSGEAGYQPADDAGSDDAQPGGGTQEAPEGEALDLLDLETPTDPEAGTLGQVKDLYLAAGRISPDSLDRHFDQLLERQRKLISDYFTESSGLGAAGTPPPLGFDSVESLAGLRGGLRDAP